MKAEQITAQLGGRWRAGRGQVRCPAHDDRNPSLSITDGDDRLLVRCFAGCDPRDILAALRRRGLIEDQPMPRVQPVHTRTRREPEHIPDKAALACWRDATRVDPGSMVARYLASRGIVLPTPLSIRCGIRLWHGRIELPTMITAVSAPDDSIVAIQETILDDKEPRKASINVPRVNTGSFGAGAVRLAAAGPVLGIAEGVEDALSAMQLHHVPCWASLGAGRLHRIVVPDEVREILCFADNDDAGRAAAERVREMQNGRRRVTVLCPPPPAKDWNDVLCHQHAQRIDGDQS